jgi:hypothetical protein
MTDDPITAALQQLADHHDQLTQLTNLVTGIGDTLREHQAARTRSRASTGTRCAHQRRMRDGARPGQRGIWSASPGGG